MEMHHILGKMSQGLHIPSLSTSSDYGFLHYRCFLTGALQIYLIKKTKQNKLSKVKQSKGRM